MRSRLVSVVLLSLAIAACGSKDKDKAKPAPVPAAGSAAPAPTPGSAVASNAWGATPPVKPTQAQIQAKTLEALSAAFNAHDSKKYASLFGDHAIVHNFGHADADNRDAIAAGLQHLFDGFPDLRFAFGRGWSTGNTMIVEWAWAGTNKPTGRPAGQAGVAIANTSESGVVNDLRLYSDDATVMSQLDPKADPATFHPPPTLPAPSPLVVASDSKDERANHEAMKGLYAALDAKKEADALAYFTADSVLEDSVSPTAAKGVDGAKGSFEGLVKTFPDFKQLPLTNQWPIGAFVISEGVLSGTHKPTGKPVSAHFVDVIEVKDGKVAHLQTWQNDVELQKQVGTWHEPGAGSGSGSAAK